MEIQQKTICPRFGRCKATKKCPISKNLRESGFDVRVPGNCIGIAEGVAKLKEVTKK